jgi:hypothetical protein
MAEDVHLDLQAAARREGAAAIERARERCRDCQAVPECQAWLATATCLPLPPEFCPNAPFFHLVMADVHGAKNTDG